MRTAIDLVGRGGQVATINISAVISSEVSSCITLGPRKLRLISAVAQVNGAGMLLLWGCGDQMTTFQLAYIFGGKQVCRSAGTTGSSFARYFNHIPIRRFAECARQHMVGYGQLHVQHLCWSMPTCTIQSTIQTSSACSSDKSTSWILNSHGRVWQIPTLLNSWFEPLFQSYQITNMSHQWTFRLVMTHLDCTVLSSWNLIIQWTVQKEQLTFGWIHQIYKTSLGSFIQYSTQFGISLLIPLPTISSRFSLNY